MSKPLNLDCPRCKQPLMVPAARTGSYVKCPRCNGSLWVPQDVGAGGSGIFTAAPPPPSGSSTAMPAVSAPAASNSGIHSSRSVPPSTLSGTLPPPVSSPSALTAPSATPASASGPVPPAAPPISAKTRKVARFISAETAQSTIKPAPDGKLPELRLDDKDRVVADENKGKSVSPLTLLAVLSLSIAVTMMLVFVDFGPSQGANLQRKTEARMFIEKYYFPNVTEGAIDKTKRPEPYQVLLTDAQQAYARGDRKTERALYNKVLNKLRAERSAFQKGLTGSPARDRDLEARITILLGPD